MKYRLWKKKYKKRYGVNPPVNIDKRKQRRLAKRAIKAISYTNFEGIAEAITNAAAIIMRGLGNAFDTAGTVCRNVADNVQPLEIKGNVLSWEVRPVVCDYGVYENNALNGKSELKLITNSRSAAEKIAEIMQQDHFEYMKLNYPERVQKRKRDIADGLALCDEGALADV